LWNREEKRWRFEIVHGFCRLKTHRGDLCDTSETGNEKTSDDEMKQLCSGKSKSFICRNRRTGEGRRRDENRAAANEEQKDSLMELLFQVTKKPKEKWSHIRDFRGGKDISFFERTVKQTGEKNNKKKYQL